MLEEIGLFPNALMDEFDEYSVISIKSDIDLFEYLASRSSTKDFCQTTQGTSITLRILAHLLVKFRDNDNDKTEIPINFEKKYFEAVKNVEDVILFQKKKGYYFEYFEDIDFDSFPGNGYSGYSYRIYKEKAHKIKEYYKFIDNEPDYKEFLEKFGLEEKQAFSIFGKYWYYILSRNDETLYWNVQRCVLRIKRSSRYRMRLEPYFERTLEFFEKIFLSNLELNRTADFQFNDVFRWDYDMSFEDSRDMYFWEKYRKFGQISGKYSKIFEEIIASYYDESVSDEEFNDEELNDEEFNDEELNDEELNDEELKAYKIMNLKNTVTLKEIHKKYRELSLKYHPDRNKSTDANEWMMKINNAYEILRLKFE